MNIGFLVCSALSLINVVLGSINYRNQYCFAAGINLFAAGAAACAAVVVLNH